MTTNGANDSTKNEPAKRKARHRNNRSLSPIPAATLPPSSNPTSTSEQKLTFPQKELPAIPTELADGSEHLTQKMNSLELNEEQNLPGGETEKEATNVKVLETLVQVESNAVAAETNSSSTEEKDLSNQEKTVQPLMEGNDVVLEMSALSLNDEEVSSPPIVEGTEKKDKEREKEQEQEGQTVETVALEEPIKANRLTERDLVKEQQISIEEVKIRERNRKQYNRLSDMYRETIDRKAYVGERLGIYQYVKNPDERDYTNHQLTIEAAIPHRPESLQDSSLLKEQRKKNKERVTKHEVLTKKHAEKTWEMRDIVTKHAQAKDNRDAEAWEEYQRGFLQAESEQTHKLVPQWREIVPELPLDPEIEGTMDGEKKEEKGKISREEREEKRKIAKQAARNFAKDAGKDLYRDGRHEYSREQKDEMRGLTLRERETSRAEVRYGMFGAYPVPHTIPAPVMGILPKERGENIANKGILGVMGLATVKHPNKTYKKERKESEIALSALLAEKFSDILGPLRKREMAMQRVEKLREHPDYDETKLMLLGLDEMEAKLSGAKKEKEKEFIKTDMQAGPSTPKNANTQLSSTKVSVPAMMSRWHQLMDPLAEKIGEGFLKGKVPDSADKKKKQVSNPPSQVAPQTPKKVAMECEGALIEGVENPKGERGRSVVSSRLVQKEYQIKPFVLMLEAHIAEADRLKAEAKREKEQAVKELAEGAERKLGIKG